MWMTVGMSANAFGTRCRLIGFIIVLGTAFILPRAILGQATNQATPVNSATADPAHHLSGVWVEKSGQAPSFLTDTRQEPPLTDWGRAEFKANKAAGQRKQNGAADKSDPHTYCDPVGMPRADLSKRPIEFVETPDEVYIFYEEDHSWRQVYLDGRPLPDPPDPSYLGYSVGKWDGDTLVVETAGLNDKTRLDGAGHPHSDALHVVERIQRTAADKLQITVTIEDPTAYSKTWTSAPRIFELKRGYELIEDYCVAPDSLGARKAASTSGSPDKQADK
jgi:hypothetical protein